MSANAQEKQNSDKTFEERFEESVPSTRNITDFTSLTELLNQATEE